MELTLEQKAERGRVARGFLASPIFADIMREAQSAFTDRFIYGEYSETAALCAWASVHALAELEDQLRKLDSDGVVADIAIKNRK